jgi:hypothetical protein
MFSSPVFPSVGAVLSVTALLAFASPAEASHVRPKGATPLRDSLVVAQKACASPTTTHNSPPAGVGACTPPANPQQESAWLTAGTPDVNGAGGNFVGYVRLDVINSPPDVNIRMQLSDVRCLPSTSAGVCPVANAAGGPDYTGELNLLLGLQISDHNNSPQQTGTIVAFQFPVKVPCISSSSTAIGSACPQATTMNAVVPGSAPGNQRMVFELPQGVPGGGIQVWDGGQNGIAGSNGSTLFAETGVFVP